MSFMNLPDEQGAFMSNTDDQDVEMSNTSMEMPLSNVQEPSNHGQRHDAPKRQKIVPQQVSNAVSAAKAAVDAGVKTSTVKAINQNARHKDTTHDAESGVQRTRKIKEEPQDDRIQKLGDELQAQKKLDQEPRKSNQELERSLRPARDLAQEKYDHGQLKVQHRGLESNHGSFENQCGGLELKLRQRETQISKLTVQIADLKQLLAEEKQSSKSIKLRLEDQQALIQELQSWVISQESSVTKAQEAAVKVLSTTVSSAIPDDSIRRQFDTLFLSLQDWARDNSNRNLSELKQSPFLSDLVDRKVLANHENWKLDHRFDIDDDTAPDTLLNASIAKEVCCAFLKKPFSFIQDSDKRSGGDSTPGCSFMPSTVSVLGSIKRRLEQENEARAHTWRAHTVEALSSGEQGKAAVHKYAEDVVATFLERYAPLLDSDIQDQDKRRLLDIVLDFGSLALQLWSQKSEVVCYGLRFFAEQPFSVSSGEMQAARAVRLEEGDTTLNGRPIPVVVQPLIVAFGTPEGKDYQKRKIWSKAVVWVSSKNNPRHTATAPQKSWIKYVPWRNGLAQDNRGTRHH